MAAPLYFQNEIASLLILKKRILGESWKELHPKDKRAAKKRENEFEMVAKMKAEPFDPPPSQSFEIEVCHNLRNDSISIQLFAAIMPRPSVPICRYDVHDSPHENPDWSPPPVIESGIFHRHIYSEKAIRQGDLFSWADCAEAVDVAPGGSPKSQLQRLRRKFIDDLNICFDDRNTEKLFVEFGPK